MVDSENRLNRNKRFELNRHDLSDYFKKFELAQEQGRRFAEKIALIQPPTIDWAKVNSMTSEFEEALHRGRKEGMLQTILQLKKHPTDEPLQVPDLYSSFMMRKSVVQQVGGVATCYTATYREETDLTLRMTLAGYKQMVIPSAVAWHVRADGGGERMPERSWEEVRSANDEIFRQRVHEWCQDPANRFAPIWQLAQS